MASVTINIADEHLSRVQAAGINKAWVLNAIKQEVLRFEQEQAAEAEDANVQAAREARQAAVDAVTAVDVS